MFNQLNEKIMRQVTVDLYSFNELSVDAKKNVIETRRDDVYEWLNDSTDDWYSCSVKAFCDEFGIRIKRDNVGYPGTFVDYEFKDDEIYTDIYAEDVTGRLLWRYLMQHYDDMVKPKTYYGPFHEWNPEEQRYNVTTHTSHVVYDANYSGIYEGFSLTGAYSDWDLLKPIVEWLHHPDKDTSLSELLQECLDAEYSAWEDERDKNYEDESIEEELSQIDDTEYCEDGSVFHGYVA